MATDEYGDEIGKCRHNYARAEANRQLREMAESILRRRLAKYVGQTVTHELREKMIGDLLEWAGR